MSGNPLAFLTAFLFAGVLLWSGLEKWRSRSRFEATLRDLQVPTVARRFLVYTIPGAEILVGGVLLLAPGFRWSGLGVGSLGLIFAVAGALALRIGTPIACSCFGATGHGTLGWRQIVFLPVWMGGATVLLSLDHSWGFRIGLQYLAALTLLLSAFRAPGLARVLRSAARDRRAMSESAVDAPPMFVQDGAGG